MGNAFADYLLKIGVPAESGGKKRGKYVSKEPTEILPFGDNLELAIWISSSKRGKSLRWNVRARNDDGDLRATVDAEDLPTVILSLISFARKLSTAEELISDTDRSRLRFITDHMDSLESASLPANGEVEKPKSFFGDTE